MQRQPPPRDQKAHRVERRARARAWRYLRHTNKVNTRIWTYAGGATLGLEVVMSIAGTSHGAIRPKLSSNGTLTTRQLQQLCTC
jgi:hypothetical protein